MVALCPKQITFGLPASANGNGLIVICTEAVVLHEVAELVSTTVTDPVLVVPHVTLMLLPVPLVGVAPLTVH
jgi:hypothetical protein